jgi:uncharacterized protein involved in exopolysaccharide biosynthesis
MTTPEVLETADTRATPRLSALQIVERVTRHWRRLVLVPFFIGSLAVAGSYLLKPAFTSSALLMPPQQGQSSMTALLGAIGGGAAGALAGAALPGLKNPADQWVQLLLSRTVADRIIERFDLMRQYDVDFRFQARDELAARTRVRATKEGLIALEVDDNDPGQAQKMAQAYVDELVALNRDIAVTEAQRRRQFFEQQLADAGKRLTDSEAALRQTGVSIAALKSDPRAALSELSLLRAQVATAEIRVAALGEQLTANSPEMRQANAQLSELRARLAALQKQDERSSTSEDYVARLRQYRYAETLYEAIARQLELARLDEARQGGLIQVVDAPQRPEWKSRPKRAFIGIFVSLAVLSVLLTHLLVSTWLEAANGNPESSALLARIRANLRRRATRADL